MEHNPVNLDGMDFIEFCGPQPAALAEMFLQLGMKKVAVHKSKKISLWRQNEINFLLNEEKSGFSFDFQKDHGPSVCSTGFRVKDAQFALQESVRRGAKAFDGGSQQKGAFDVPAIFGIGESLVYFIDQYGSDQFWESQFEFITSERHPNGDGLLYIDHLTNNVPFGEMDKWCKFYEEVFNFKERRFFDIKGAQTGLLSKVMRSPCNKITIPINEPDRENSKSQIQEYINEYKGSGIQHIALITEDIQKAVASILDRGVRFLDAPDTYFDKINDRVPRVTESISDLKRLRILVDGDEEGYLLQIFTQNMCGPIFFEIIQRKNHHGFGNGNFQALFEAIEEDQRRRGVL